MARKQKQIQSIYISRELSWLKFNERVLEEASDENVPLFERLKYISIFMNNLDEFFMIRVGSLQDQSLIKEAPVDNKTGMTPREQIAAVMKSARRIVSRKNKVYASCVKKLAKYNVRHVDMSELNEQDEEFLRGYYIREIYPLLSPQIIDNRHPFPFLINKGIYVGVYFISHRDIKFGIIPAYGAFSRMIALPGAGIRFVLAEDVIYHYTDMIFGSHNLIDKMVFRVTRNADIISDAAMFEEDTDFRFIMKELLKKRVKLAPVRLEIRGELKKEFIKYLCKKLSLEQSRVFISDGPLDLSYVGRLEEMLSDAVRKKTMFQPLVPQDSPMVAPGRIFPQVLEKDLLLSYPYENMKPFIRLMYEAAEDPDVVSIKITLYRVGRESEIVRSLITAAENGKDVIVVVELRARFDEQDNIEWATRLSDAGCRVIYGVEECKVHSKLLLITRKTGKSIQYITQIGTGNYNERTARQYTDLSLITSNSEIGLDAVALFNDILVNNINGTYKTLMVAPASMRASVISLIQTEIDYVSKGEPASIFAKMNSLTDKAIIDKLIEASAAGVKIRLIVRGICCLRSGVPGITDNITILSVVGRFLEHERVYCFGEGQRRRVFISSADWMTRNTERRIEVACPIYDNDIADRIVGMMETCMSDNTKARLQQPDGTYVRQEPAEGEAPLYGQMLFFERAYEAAGASRTEGDLHPKMSHDLPGAPI